jgi:O-acetylserine/cysteine efflux transporter
MAPIHAALAILVACLWGVAFVVSKIGLAHFSAAQLTALRFLVAAVAVLWLPRPKISVALLLAIGLTIFTGQFLLQFFGMASGMPAGLTAVVVQTQALFTVAFAAVALGDRPTGRQLIGMVFAMAGLLTIGMALGGTVTSVGFTLTLASAISWAVGNVLVKRAGTVDMLHLMVWASLVPPLPALAVSAFLDGPLGIVDAVAGAPWSALLAPVYLGLVASVFAYAAWGTLLRHYSTGAVAPFALLAPCVGAVGSAAVFGERFSSAQIVGMGLLLLGVAVVAMPRKSLLLQATVGMTALIILHHLYLT